MTAPLHFASVAWRLGVTWFILIVTMIVGKAACRSFGDGPEASLVFRGILPSLVVLTVIVLFQMRLGRHGVRASLSALGVGRPNAAQLSVAFRSVIPILIAYAIIFVGMGASTEHEEPLALFMLKYAVGQGLAEELCFRAFAFRLLRPGRSFSRAAFLSALLFSVVHLTSLMKGVSSDNLISVALSMVYAFVLAFPFALLFERGGNSIWGVALVHWAVDSNNYFPVFTEVGLPLAVYLGLGVAGCLAMIVWLARRLEPPPGDSRESGVRAMGRPDFRQRQARYGCHLRAANQASAQRSGAARRSHLRREEARSSPPHLLDDADASRSPPKQPCDQEDPMSSTTGKEIAIILGEAGIGVVGGGEPLTVVKRIYALTAHGKMATAVGQVEAEEDLKQNLRGYVRFEMEAHLDELSRNGRLQQVIAAHRAAPAADKPPLADVVGIVDRISGVAEETRDKAKRRLLAAAIVNAFDPALYKTGLVERAVEVLPRLTYPDVVVLRETALRDVQYAEVLHPESKVELLFMTTLVDLRLVHDGSGFKMNNNTNMFRITALGRALVELLRETPLAPTGDQ